MDYDNLPEEQSHYQTGITPRKKLRRGVLALLLIAAIFLGGLFSSLRHYNIIRFQAPTAESRGKPAPVRFAQGPSRSAEQAPGLPALGLTGQAVSVFEQQYFRIPQGVCVRQTAPDSPAEQAGLLPGDVLTGIDNSRIADLDTLTALLGKRKAGDSVCLEIYRNGKTQTVVLILSEP